MVVVSLFCDVGGAGRPRPVYANWPGTLTPRGAGVLLVQVSVVLLAPDLRQDRRLHPISPWHHNSVGTTLCSAESPVANHVQCLKHNIISARLL